MGPKSIKELTLNELKREIPNLVQSAAAAGETIPGEMTITWIDETEDPILPGVFHLQKGFNALKGVPYFEGAQSDRDIFTLTFNGGKTTSGSTPYQVPD
jgi:hypothetical protein